MAAQGSGDGAAQGERTGLGGCCGNCACLQHLHTAPTLAGTFFRDDAFLQANGLSVENALQYFQLSPFFKERQGGR